MRYNFRLLDNINVIVNFTNVVHERRLAPHDDYHLFIIQLLCQFYYFVHGVYTPGVPHTLAKLAICYCILYFGY